MTPMPQDLAERFAIDVLGWLAGDEDLMPVFLGSTGASIDDIRSRAGEPEFLGSVLDFLMMDDAWVTSFCDAVSMPYDAPMRARAGLPGGSDVNWT